METKVLWKQIEFAEHFKIVRKEYLLWVFIYKRITTGAGLAQLVLTFLTLQIKCEVNLIFNCCYCRYNTIGGSSVQMRRKKENRKVKRRLSMINGHLYDLEVVCDYDSMYVYVWCRERKLPLSLQIFFVTF